MHTFKACLFSILFFAGIGFTVSYSSCNTDPCKDLFCKNGGSCREGLCKCPDGFTGPFCEAKLIDRMIGTFYGYVRCKGSPATYTEIIIVPGDNAKTVRVYQLFGQNSQFTATVKDDNTFDMPLQTINGVSMKGNGYIESSKYIHFYYDITDVAGSISSCIYDATKQF